MVLFFIYLGVIAMHSIQKIGTGNVFARGFVNFSSGAPNLQSKINLKSEKVYKTVYLTSGLACLGVIGAAVYAIQTKNKNAVKKLFKPYQEELFNFDAYLKKAQEANISTPNDYLANCIEKNIIGTGQNSKVYKFTNPLMNNWVIKVETKHNDYLESFFQGLKQLPDEFVGFNMGQPIAKIGERVKILKKIDGKPHSIKDWSSHRRNQIPITQDDAKTFLADIKQIAKFPQETFDEYAQKLKLLDDKLYKADSFNPNNYLIDYKNQKIYIIDAYKYAPDEHLNSKFDLICPLVDFPNFERFYNVMNKDQRTDYIAITKTLVEKCTKAAKNMGINTSEDFYRDFIGRVDGRENNNSMYTRSFNAMKNICKDIEI